MFMNINVLPGLKDVLFLKAVYPKEQLDEGLSQTSSNAYIPFLIF